MVDKNGGFNWANWAPKDWISLTSAKSMSAARLVAPSPAPFLFFHRQTGKAIYKRKSPDGEWYVFRSSHRNRSDESMKLKYGDYVTGKQNRIKARL
ncbi:DUF995 domain-containing protein [Mesorhizobium australicum]|uniref:DUF995 domain-containing protein n=1 Tax=Mesorhizobium australicum TaxID=536018 RepID=UPI00333DE1F3